MERQITGFGRLAGACVMGSKISGSGNKFGGLSGWVVAGGGATPPRHGSIAIQMK